MVNDFDRILILDFGSQYTQLIARRVRELGVYSEITYFKITAEEIKASGAGGIILSGGPQSVYSENAPLLSPEIFSLGIPVLGICYGLQLMAHLLGGRVSPSSRREYGRSVLEVEKNNSLFKRFKSGSRITVWMSHGDFVEELPEGFLVLGRTENCPFAAAGFIEKNLFGVQFHPEVSHTERGKDILGNFLFEICKLRANWSMDSFIVKEIQEIKNRVKKGNVICALSGGVDSSVVASLLGKAVGKKAKAIFINNGLLRKNEEQEVLSVFCKQKEFDLIYEDASERFLDKLRGVYDPEKKRKVIGHEFIRVFEEQAKKLGEIEYLAQGTLYPDVIESKSFRGPSSTIKSHHNVGGLPGKMKLKLIEPLKDPFPGPGLAVRIVGEVTPERLSTLREADYIIIEEIKKAGLYQQIWQAFGVLLPVKSVGVMGDERTYEGVCVLRAVTSVDGMTADWYRFPYQVLDRISYRIVSEVRGINRVVYDITSKPPSTIEWE